MTEPFRRRMLNPQSPAPPHGQRYFIVILVMGFLIQMTALGFGRFAYTALLPSMKTDAGLTNTHMGFFQVGILTGYLLFAYLCSAFVKRWGLSLVINVSLALVGLAMMALGFTSSFLLWLILAFLIGSGAAGTYIPLIPLIIGWSSIRRSGGAIGFALSGTGVGIIVVGFVAPIILERFGTGGWRYAWFLLGAASLLVWLASVFLLKENPSFVDGAEHHNAQDSILGLLYRDRSLRAILIVYLMVGFGYISFATFAVAYAVEEIMLSAKEAGLLWSIFGLFSVFGCLFWGIVSDYIGRKAVTIIDLFLLSASILLAVLWKEKAGLYLSGALFAFTFNGVIVLIAALFGDYIPMAKMSRIFGISTLIHGLGQVVGVALAGWLKDLTATFVVSFFLSALIIGACPLLLFFLKEPEKL
ncbi:MAG: YbfB/YjiJ family MFS transporter [Proteobacteria bacterium]|nr:YbfB/YjiJ family MFS transporter [Pseudomonadota bacterium]